MFTGLIEYTSEVRAVKDTDHLMTLTLQNPFQTLSTGDSVSVNGTCLTVTDVTTDDFTVEIINETKRITSLSGLKETDEVNLERAMKMNGRLDGHMVSGHVDGTGTIAGIKIDGGAVVVDIECPHRLMKYMSPKGSVTIDGISLTLFDVDLKHDRFTLNIIPETFRKTAVKHWDTGSSVNIEADLVMKHIDHLMPSGRGLYNV